MKIQRVFLAALLYPFRVEPVRRIVGIAVEPHFRAVHGASCKRLLNEGTRHKHDLIEENARECDTLYQGRRALVSAAEEVEAVSFVVQGDIDIVHAELFRANEPAAAEHFEQRSNDIAPERGNGLAAHRERHAVEFSRSPHHEAE